MKNILKYLQPIGAILWNILVAMVLFTVTRILFIVENSDIYQGLSLGRAAYLCLCGLRFDLTASLYTSLIFILMTLLPLRVRNTKAWAAITKWAFIVPIVLALFINLADTVYFKYTTHRSTAAFFSEFKGEDNLGKIFFAEVFNHWYFVIAGIAMLVILILCYKAPRPEEGKGVRYYLTHTLILLLCIFPLTTGLRGTLILSNHPVTPDLANQYIEKPSEASVILNTPFTIYRTINRKPFITPTYYTDAEELKQVFDPLFVPEEGAEFKPMNICYLILESFSACDSEYLTSLRGKKEEGYMPFLDSLMQESFMYRWSFANGHKSIEAMPSLLSSLPSMIVPIVLSSYCSNDMSGIARELCENKGYTTAFFHGAPRGSMGFEAFTNLTGFRKLYDMETFGDDSQYDGTWAIYDEPFLKYSANEIGKLQEPFVASIFTATSHHPFKLPKEAEKRFKGGSIPMYKCIEYADNAVREFFDIARSQPWYDNTIFIISGDHASETDRAEYNTDYGTYQIPILIHVPSGGLKGFHDGIAQQIDMMPTIMRYLGYDKPFVCFGNDLLNTPEEDHWAFNYNNGIYQFYKNRWCLLFDGEKVIGLYDFKNDLLQKQNLASDNEEVIDSMLPLLKAIIQQYVDRVTSNQLTIIE